MRVILKPKVFLFPCFFPQMAAKSSSLSHVSFLESMMRTKSTRALSFSFYQHFAGQNDQLRLKSSKTVLKAFQLIFPWLKMKRKTLCISNLDSWVDQKKHLNKDAQKKFEVEMCDDQLRFFLFLVLLSRRPKSWIFSSSPIFDKSQISLFSWALVLDLHRLHVFDGKNVVLAPARL